MRDENLTFSFSQIDATVRLTHRELMKLQTYSAILRKDEGWWIGWVEEIPGVNSQGKTRMELIKNLRSALREAIELNREEALAFAGPQYEQAELKV
jgi:predicted RNase H-like HicB family nuclease